MTKTLTIDQARACHPLAPAVLRQLGDGRITREAIDTAIEAGRHGADAGWHGFTWTRDTVAFSKRHREAIVACIERQSIELGERGPVSLVVGFRCLNRGISEMHVAAALYGNGVHYGPDIETVLNALAWYALEEVGRALEAEAEG